MQLQKFKKIGPEEIPQEWNIIPLRDVCKNITDGKHGDCKNEFDSGYYFISAKDIFDGKIHYENARQITKSDFLDAHKRTKIEPEDILLTNSGSIGKLAIVENIFNTTRTTFQKSVALLKLDVDKIFGKYCYYYLYYNREQLETIASGSSQKNLLLRQIASFKILLPLLSEQQKIGSILSNIDELIQKREQIIEKTRILYKGLMQKLLIKGIGHSKFKKINLGINFLNYKVPLDWKLLKIKDIASVHGRIGWKGLKREEYTETGPLMLSVWSLTNEYPYGVNYSAGVNRLSTFRFDESPEIKLKNGDVLLAKDGDIGRIGYVKSLHEPTTVNSHVVVVRTKNDIINNEFLYWFMSSNPFQTYCKSFTSGTTVPLLSQSNIREAIILIPSLSEQKTISSILYSVSNIIHKHRIYKNKIQEIKKGLMQQLLTGKIRVQV